MEDACGVDGCVRPRYGKRKYCNSHYMRMYRYGDPHWKAPRRYIDIKGKKYGTLTVDNRLDSTWWECVCECGETVKKTYADLNRYGLPTCGKPGRHLRDDVDYFTAHRRVSNVRGKASRHLCSCGRNAQQWAYNHKDAHQKVGIVGGVETPYSTDPEFYNPMCVPCHKRFDLERRANENAKEASSRDSRAIR